MTDAPTRPARRGAASRLTGLCLRLLPGGSGKAAAPALTATVLSTERIPLAAAAATPPAEVRLSPLDLGASVFVTCAAEFFYAAPLDAARLRGALALVQAQVPLFAGRLAERPNRLHVVELTGAGLAFSVADSPNSLADARPAADDDAGQAACGPFAPLDFSAFHPASAPRSVLGFFAPGAPLVHVQLTRLAGGAACVAYLGPHALFDLGTAKLLAGAVCAAYAALGRGQGWSLRDGAVDVPDAEKKGGEGEDADPAGAGLPTGRDVLFSYASAAAAAPPGYAPALFEPRGRAFVPRVVARGVWARARHGPARTVGYYVPRARLAALKAQAAAALAAPGAAAPAGAAAVSARDALAARVWQVLSRLPAKAAAARRAGQPFGLAVAVDLRDRLKPAPPPAVGNLVWAVVLAPRRADGGEPSLGEAAAALRGELQDFDAAKVAGELRWLRAQEAAGVPTIQRGVKSGPTGPGAPVLLTTWAWNYEALAFDGNKVAWHAPQLLPAAPNVVYVVPSPAPSDGVYVYFCLHEAALRQLEAACTAL